MVDEKDGSGRRCYKTSSDAPLVEYPDIGESGETLEIDFQTVPSPKLYRWSGLFFSLKTPSGRLDDSKSGEAYEVEVEATHLNGVREALTLLPSASMCDI